MFSLVSLPDILFFLGVDQNAQDKDGIGTGGLPNSGFAGPIPDPRSTTHMPKTLTPSQSSRVISFRVSEHEFKELRLACTGLNVRSLSQFARQAAFELARSARSDQNGRVEASDLESTLARLNSTLTEITRFLRTGDSAQPRSPVRELSIPFGPSR